MDDAGKASELQEELPAGPYYQRAISGSQIHQGEILRNVWEWVPEYDDTGLPTEVKPNRSLLALVVTQECDLTQDYRSRADNLLETTELKSVLLCPAQDAEVLRDTHSITSKRWSTVRDNKDERYHYLSHVASLQDIATEGHPAMLVDFKSFFTVRTAELYRQLSNQEEQSAKWFVRLGCPWREHLQVRFAAYVARVGLPLDHFVQESRRHLLKEIGK